VRLDVLLKRAACHLRPRLRLLYGGMKLLVIAARHRDRVAHEFHDRLGVESRRKGELLAKLPPDWAGF
jgi:hypothetical protein